MGLLDNLFFGQNADFGGQQGGLLDFLRNAQMQNSQYQPSTGLPPAPQPASFADRFNALPNAPQPFNPAPRQMDATAFDPATFAPNQAQPTPVGNYQMPRIGSASQFMPPQQDQSAIPPNAQPTQGQLPQAPSTDISAQSRPAAEPAIGAGDRLMAGIQNFANAGSPLQALAGGLGGLVSGQRTDPQGMQQQALSATYRALVEAGVPRNTAMAAAMNPKVLEQIAPSYFGKNELVDGGTYPLTGQKQFFWKNGADQTLVPANPAQPGASGGGTQSGGMQALSDKISAMRAQGATKEQLLAQLPAGYREDVGSLISGKAVPANMGRAQSRMALLTLAKVIDPNFDETQIPGRVKMRSDFMGEGKNGQAIGALNTVQHHADQVSDAISEFEKAGGGSDSPLWNAGKLMLANNTSYDPKLRDSAQKLKDKLNATEHEVASAYNAGHLSDHDLKTWNEIKAENLPAGQLKQKLADFVDLLNGKRDSLNHMYRQQFGEDAPAIDKEANIATTAKIHQRLPQYGGAASSGLPSGWSVTVR